MTLNESLVLLALGSDGFQGAQNDLADLANVSRGSLHRILKQLSAKGFISVQRKRILVLPEALGTLSALERTIQDWNSLRFADFTKEEVLLFKTFSKRIRQNVRNALK